MLYSGNFENADKWLENDKRGKKQKNQLLHLLNRGYVARMLNDYQRSITYFNEADQLIEDYKKNYGAEALSLISNPTVKPYKPEDFESVLIHYFQANNYLSLNNLEDALVECKRINIQLNELNDKYPDHKNKYQRDAFANLTMGLIYDDKKDYNNAFIAYRNAYEIYKNDYAVQFNISIPEQLKQDILRTASLSGLWNEVDFYQKEFNITYTRQDKPYAELIFFWENGFGPVKSEWSINVSSNIENGMLIIANEEMGIYSALPIPIGFENTGILRIAFPKYVERRPIYTSGNIMANNQTYPLEQAENINEIAFKCLHDRMGREIANSISRLIAKKTMEAAMRKQNEFAGALVGIAGAVTEKTDTRNWQTLPYNISYSRIPLHEGLNNIRFNIYGNAESKSIEFTFTPQKGQTIFHTYHVLDTERPQ